MRSADMSEVTSSQATVIKIGGGELDSEAFLQELVSAIRGLRDDGESIVVVHGGGKTIAQYQQALGLEPEFLDGLRVTTAESLAVAEMVLSGLLNKRLVRHLTAACLPACGISGVDAGTVLVTKMTHPQGDLGQVGEVVEVNPQLLWLLLAGGYVPVVSPISIGQTDGRSYNVNADHAAMGIAAALAAPSLVFLTNVPGVLIAGRIVRALIPAQAEEWIREGFIQGGMIPKVRSALLAVERGVARAVITNLAGLSSGSGTSVVSQSH